LGYFFSQYIAKKKNCPDILRNPRPQHALYALPVFR